MSVPWPARATVHVAVGVLIRPDGAVLLADRPSGKPFAGFWEFPGGKIEDGESVDAALRRELHEELGIDIGPSVPWFTFEHDYPHAYVRLHFRRVFAWKGEPFSREGQRVGFFPLNGDFPAPLLPATKPAMRWLDLPDVYAVSRIGALGIERFIEALQVALGRGLRILVLREPELDESRVRAVIPAVLAMAHASNASMLISSRHAQALWAACDGVHLTARDLMRESKRPVGKWVAASVHDRAELAHAQRIGCDFAVMGPVLPTASHPGGATLGWSGFAALAEETPIPVYAIGGLGEADLPAARCAGAHGVALMRAAWKG
jgi:8-oxo-dGTP diphosphatase